MRTVLVFILLLGGAGNPPGTIKVKNLYADKTEIQNIHWLEFLHHKGKELDPFEINRLLPDSSNSWYSMRDRRYEPIVLITYEQALEYCAWRSKVVSERLGKKVTYRLPSTSEWKEIAEEIVRTDQKQIKKELEGIKKMLGKDSTQYILAGREKPKARIYDLFDNVTEMTTEKGVGMGSSNHQLTDLKTNLTRLVKYDSPNKYLGFRCVAEVE